MLIQGQHSKARRRRPAVCCPVEKCRTIASRLPTVTHASPHALTRLRMQLRPTGPQEIRVALPGWSALWRLTLRKTGRVHLGRVVVLLAGELTPFDALADPRSELGQHGV